MFRTVSKTHFQFGSFGVKCFCSMYQRNIFRIAIRYIFVCCIKSFIYTYIFLPASVVGMLDTIQWIKGQGNPNEPKLSFSLWILCSFLRDKSRKVSSLWITYTQMHTKKQKNKWERENCKNAFWKQCTNTASTISNFEFFFLSVDWKGFIHCFSLCRDLCCIRFKPTETQFPFSQRHTKYKIYTLRNIHGVQCLQNTRDFFKDETKEEEKLHIIFYQNGNHTFLWIQF